MTQKQIYKKIAKTHGVHWTEVRDDMQAAIQHAYENPDRNILNVVTQSKIKKKGEIPTVKEVIQYSSQRVKEELSENNYDTKKDD